MFLSFGFMLSGVLSYWLNNIFGIKAVLSVFGLYLSLLACYLSRNNKIIKST